MKQFYFLLFFFAVTVSVEAQQLLRSTLSASGASETIASGDETYVLQQSVGQQSVIGSFSTETVSARQGFIQPPIKISRIVEEDTDLDAVVYPNPFESSVRILFNEEIDHQLSVVLYDMQGRLVYNQEYEPARELQINLDFLSSAPYVLLVTSENKQLKANLLKN